MLRPAPTLCGRKLGKEIAEFPFTSEDIRFTEGRNGAVYAFCMKAPRGGEVLRIKNLGTNAGRMQDIRKVKLLGHKGKVQWRRTAEALEITCPQRLPFESVLAFRIE